VTEPSEDELDRWMARLAEGHRDAFDPLFRSLYQRALRLARARLPADAASDVAQSTMMKLFARAADFEAGRPVLPWFYAIAANEMRAAIRQGDRLVAVAEMPDPPSEDNPERAIVERELARALEVAISSLDAPSAEAIHAVLGRGPAPVIEPATLRKRVSRAYARLRALLGAAHGD
jgi:RNA polymerase sigma-70 factor (ECF subfamily)